MTPTVAPPNPAEKHSPTPATLARQANLEKRNQALRDAFYTRFTIQAKPRIYTREYVVSQLAQEHHLSMVTVERIVAVKQK